MAKKLFIELDEEGIKNVFKRNKWGEFLTAIQSVALGKSAKMVKGTIAFLKEEDSVLGDLFDTKTLDVPPSPVSDEDFANLPVLDMEKFENAKDEDK